MQTMKTWQHFFKKVYSLFFEEKWKRMTFFSVFLFIFAVLVYYPLLRIGFLSDDWGYVIMARDSSFFDGVSFLWSLDLLGSGGGNFRPLASLMTVILWKPLLYYPEVLHLMAIFLHVVVALLVGFLSKQILKKNVFYVASLVFMILPLNVEVVAWLCANWNTTFALIALLSFLNLYLFFKNKTILIYSILTGLFFVSVLFKEFALLLPFLVLGVGLIKFRKINYLFIVYLFFLDSLYFVWRFFVINELGGYGNHFIINDKILKYFEMIGGYFISYHELVPILLKLIMCIFISIIFLGGAVKLYKKNRKTFKRTFVVLCGLIYVSNFFGWNIFDLLSEHIAHNRVLYLSNVFFVVLFVYLLSGFKKKHQYFLVIIYVVLSLLVSFYQIKPWVTAGETTKSVLSQVLNQNNGIELNEMKIINLPDNYKGAFIFRNGIDQAVSFYKKIPYKDKFIEKKYQDQIELKMLIESR